MKTTFDTINNQIANQITNSTEIKIVFRETEQFCGEERNITATITLIDQSFLRATNYFIKYWGNSKKISEDLFNSLKSIAVDEREFCTDPLTVNWQSSYDEFFEEYWN